MMYQNIFEVSIGFNRWHIIIYQENHKNIVGFWTNKLCSTIRGRLYTRAFYAYGPNQQSNLDEILVFIPD